MSEVKPVEVDTEKPFKLDFGLIGMIIAALVICWAFYTTSSGMVDIMRKGPGDWVGSVGATVGSAAILSTLALTSWLLGSDLAPLLSRRAGAKGTNLGRTLVIGCIFLFVFCMSAFFSFTYYYNNIFGLSARELVGQAQPVELARQIIPPLEQLLEKNSEEGKTSVITALNASPYFTDLKIVSDAAGVGGENFSQGLEALQRSLRRATEKRAQDQENRIKSIQDAQRRILLLTDELANAKREIESLDKLISPKQKQIADLEATVTHEDSAAVDARNGLDGRRAICGENCTHHQDIARKARATIQTIRKTLSPLNKRRSDRSKDLDEMQTQLASLREKAEVNAANRANAESSPTGSNNVDLSDLPSTLQRFDEAQARFRNSPAWSGINAIARQCNTLLTVAKQLNMKLDGLSRDFNCEPRSTDARDLLTARDALQQARQAFDKQCSLKADLGRELDDIVARLRVVSSTNKSAGLNEARVKIDACINRAHDAGLSEVDTQRFLGATHDFVNNNSLDRDRFQLASQAFRSGTPVANLALGVAVAQDAFILILKLLAEIFAAEAPVQERAKRGMVDVIDKCEDAPALRARKALLREARVKNRRSSEFDLVGDPISRLSSETRDNLNGLLNALTRAGQASRRSNGIYQISNVAIDEIEDEVAASAPAVAEPTKMSPPAVSSASVVQVEPNVPPSSKQADASRLADRSETEPLRRGAFSDRYLFSGDFQEIQTSQSQTKDSQQSDSGEERDGRPSEAPTFKTLLRKA